MTKDDWDDKGWLRWLGMAGMAEMTRDDHEWPGMTEMPRDD